MEKWEAAQTSKTGLSVLAAKSSLVHFQAGKFIIASVDEAHP